MIELDLARKYAIKRYFNGEKSWVEVVEHRDMSGLKDEFQGLHDFEVANLVVMETSKNADMLREYIEHLRG